MIIIASELKVIIGGLGDGPGWPTVEEAVTWERLCDVSVYIQPRNFTKTVDLQALDAALKLLDANPTLKLSVQLHKFIGTR